MSNGRNSGKRGDSGRDPGGFVALPWSVMDSPAYAALSHPARSLLLEIARQFVRDNNGRLLASRAYLAKRGWNSPDVISRAKNDLLEAGFIHETVKGHRPNKASWYAVTWRALDRLPGYDEGAAATFVRGAYQNAKPRPSPVLERAAIGPSPVLGRQSPSTSPVPIKALFATSPSTSPVHHLEMPSPATSTTNPKTDMTTINPSIDAPRNFAGSPEVAPQFVPDAGQCYAHMLENKTVFLVEPSAKHAGYFFITRLDRDGEHYDCTKRPVSAEWVETNLQHYGLDAPAAAAWKVKQSAGVLTAMETFDGAAA